MIAHHGGKRRAIDAVAAENEPAHCLSQALKMKKDQRMTGIDQIVADIPRREVRPDVLDDSNARKQPREPIEIPLVGKAISVDDVMTPFDASLSPPSNDGDAVGIVASSDPSHIIGPELP